MLSGLKRIFAVVIGCACLGVAPAMAELPAAPRPLTTPPTGGYDAYGDVVTLPGGGFIVAYTRGVGIATVLRVRQFGPTGLTLVTKPEVQIGTPAFGRGARPKMVLASPTSVAMVWQQGDRVVGGLFNLTTNAMGTIRDFGKAGDLIHDIVKLDDGKFAVVHVDDLPAIQLREKVSVTLLSSAMVKVGGPFSVHGSGFRLDPWNSFDHTIVSKVGGGGFVFFRDRVTANLMMRPFSASGAMQGVVTRVNSSPLLIGTVNEYVRFEVKAARLTNGRIAVVWSGFERTGADGFEVRVRVLSPAGVPIGPDARVHTSSRGAQVNPEVVALTNGGFVVTWVDDENFLSRKLTARTFNNNGAPVSAPRVTESGFSIFLSNDTDMALMRDGSIVNILSGFIGLGDSGRLKAEGFRP